MPDLFSFFQTGSSSFELDILTSQPLYGYSLYLNRDPLSETFYTFTDANSLGIPSLDYGATTEPLTLLPAGYYHLADFQFQGLNNNDILTASGTGISSTFQDFQIQSSSYIVQSVPEPLIFPLIFLILFFLKRKRNGTIKT